MRRVLVAVGDPARRRIATILADCELHFVDSCEALLRVLDEPGFDLAIVGAHFDESSGVAALERIFSRHVARPVVCVRGAAFASGLGGRTVDALRLATEEIGVQYFLDLVDYPDDDAGNARARRMFERLLRQ